jgi:hypothetical protein
MRISPAHLLVAGLGVGAAGLTITMAWLVVVGAVGLTAATTMTLFRALSRRRR